MCNEYTNKIKNGQIPSKSEDFDIYCSVANGGIANQRNLSEYYIGLYLTYLTGHVFPSYFVEDPYNRFTPFFDQLLPHEPIKTYELDFYNPNFTLALEYNGPEHYSDSKVMLNDIRKEHICKAQNICFIGIKHTVLTFRSYKGLMESGNVEALKNLILFNYIILLVLLHSKMEDFVQKTNPFRLTEIYKLYTYLENIVTNIKSNNMFVTKNGKNIFNVTTQIANCLGLNPGQKYTFEFVQNYILEKNEPNRDPVALTRPNQALKIINELEANGGIKFKYPIYKGLYYKPSCNSNQLQNENSLYSPAEKNSISKMKNPTMNFNSNDALDCSGI